MGTVDSTQDVYRNIWAVKVRGSLQDAKQAINTTLTNVFLQERHFGVPNYALFNLMALTKDRNLIPRIELSIIDTSHPLNCIFYYFLIIFLTVSF